MDLGQGMEYVDFHLHVTGSNPRWSLVAKPHYDRLPVSAGWPKNETSRDCALLCALRANWEVKESLLVSKLVLCCSCSTILRYIYC